MHIGNIKLGQIDLNHGKAEISYFIGNKSFWGNGLISEAIHLITEYATKKKKLQFIMAGVYETNIASRKVLKKNGYKLECILKKQLINTKGKREDHYLYRYKAS